MEPERRRELFEPLPEFLGVKTGGLANVFLSGNYKHFTILPSYHQKSSHSLAGQPLPRQLPALRELLQLQQRHHRNPFRKAREERADLHVGLELLPEGLFEPGAPVRKS